LVRQAEQQGVSLAELLESQSDGSDAGSIVDALLAMTRPPD
jgi:hypothetical protein